MKYIHMQSEMAKNFYVEQLEKAKQKKNDPLLEKMIQKSKNRVMNSQDIFSNSPNINEGVVH